MYKPGQLITVNGNVYRVKKFKATGFNPICIGCPEENRKPLWARPCEVCADVNKMPDNLYFEKL